MHKHLYVKVGTICDFHGMYFTDPHKLHNKELPHSILCPTCNPAVKVHQAVANEKVISQMNKVYPKELQLEPKDIPIIRAELLDLQNGVCPLCNKMLSKMCLDHYHQKRNNGNGKVRQVLCTGCNSMLGVIENSLPRYLIDYSDAPTWLENVADYLRCQTTNLIHPTERKRITLKVTEFKAFAQWVKDTLGKVIKFPKKGVLPKTQEVLYKQYLSKDTNE